MPARNGTGIRVWVVTAQPTAGRAGSERTRRTASDSSSIQLRHETCESATACAYRASSAAYSAWSMAACAKSIASSA
jgi:hypothetical protein